MMGGIFAATISQLDGRAVAIAFAIAGVALVVMVAAFSPGEELRLTSERNEKVRALWLSECSKPLDECAKAWDESWTLRDLYDARVPRP